MQVLLKSHNNNQELCDPKHYLGNLFESSITTMQTRILCKVNIKHKHAKENADHARIVVYIVNYNLISSDFMKARMLE